MLHEDLENVVFAGDLDEPARLKDVHAVEFSDNSQIVERCFELRTNLADGGLTESLGIGRDREVVDLAEDHLKVTDRRVALAIQAFFMCGRCEPKVVDDDSMNVCLPEPGRFWVALERNVDGEDMSRWDGWSATVLFPPFAKLVVNAHEEGDPGGGASANAFPASAPMATRHSLAVMDQYKQQAGCSTQVAYVSATVTARPYFLPPLHVPRALKIGSPVIGSSLMRYIQTNGRTVASAGRGMGSPNMSCRAYLSCCFHSASRQVW